MIRIDRMRVVKKSIWVVLFFGAVAAADWEVAPDLEGGMVSLDVRAAPMAMGATAAGTTHASAEYQIYKWGAATSLSSPILYETLKDPNPIRPTNFEVIAPVINTTVNILQGVSLPTGPDNKAQAAGYFFNGIFGN